MSLVQRTALRRLQPHSRHAPSQITRHGALPASRRNYTWGAMTDSIAQGIISVHNVGMPWWVTIPVVAATVNFTIRLPLQLYGQKIRNERQKIQPLAYAWSAVIRREAENKIHALNITGRNEQMKKRREAWKRLSGVYSQMYKEFNCQTWKAFVPWASMVPFVAFADAIRKIAGVNALSGFQTPVDVVHRSSSLPPEPLELSSDIPLLDQSLLDGGLLWFSDLSVADPWCALPLACSAVLAAQIWPKVNTEYVFGHLFGRDPAKVATGYGRLQGAAQRALILMPLFPLLWLNLPSAVVLYALTTFSFNALNSYLAVKLFPKPVVKLSPMTKVADQSVFLHSGHVPEDAEPSAEAEDTESVPEAKDTKPAPEAAKHS